MTVAKNENRLEEILNQMKTTNQRITAIESSLSSSVVDLEKQVLSGEIDTKKIVNMIH